MGGNSNSKLHNQDEDVKLDQEVIISTWVNELELSLKTYDIVSICRYRDDQSCKSINNEIFNIVPETEKIRVHTNPRKRHKTLTSLVLSDTKEHDLNNLDEVNKIRAPNYASDHRDNRLEKRIKDGYKIIGVKGFKNTYDSTVLHMADFIIWKPPPGWLDISPEERAR